MEIFRHLLVTNAEIFTMYMPPLTDFIFGMVNNATCFMDVFIWGEGTANRGADNIVSCLNKYLTKYGVVGAAQPTSSVVSNNAKLGRLVVIADNCAGQNKNNCVIKYCCWLVEAGWCGEVVLFFLIKGHTKNECDSKFNKLKSGTRGVNIFTEEGLDAAFLKNNTKEIALHRVPVGDNSWRAWTKGLSNLYRNVESGQLKKNHIFIFGGKNNTRTTIARQLYRDASKIVSYLKSTTAGKSVPLTPEQRSKTV